MGVIMKSIFFAILLLTTTLFAGEITRSSSAGTAAITLGSSLYSITTSCEAEGHSEKDCGSLKKEIIAAQDDAAAYLMGGEMTATLASVINQIRALGLDKSDEDLAIEILNATN
jgi:hypothetical protein